METCWELHSKFKAFPMYYHWGTCWGLHPKCSHVLFSNENMLNVASKAFPCITIGEHVEGCIQSVPTYYLAMGICWVLHPKRSHVLPLENMLRVASKAFPCIIGTIGEHVEGCIQSVPMYYHWGTWWGLHPKCSHVLPLGNMLRVASKESIGHMLRVASKAFPCINNGNMMTVASKAFPCISDGNMMRVASQAFPCINIGEHVEGCIQSEHWEHVECCIQNVPMY